MPSKNRRSAQAPTLPVPAQAVVRRDLLGPGRIGLVAAIAPESSSIVHFDVLERSCRPEIVLDGTIGRWLEESLAVRPVMENVAAASWGRLARLGQFILRRSEARAENQGVP